MSTDRDAAHFLRDARRRAGLTQRELARRAGTAQSVVVRIERNQSSPTWQKLLALIAAAGFELDCELVLRPASDSHMLEDVARILSLSPEDRLAEVRNINEFLSGARRG